MSWRSQIAYLVADPSGVSVLIDEQPRLHLPTDVVIAVTSSGEDPAPLSYVDPATLPRMSFVLRVSDDESDVWDLAVVDPTGVCLSAVDVAEIARIVAGIVDVRTSDPLGSLPGNHPSSTTATTRSFFTDSENRRHRWTPGRNLDACRPHS